MLTNMVRKTTYTSFAKESSEMGKLKLMQYTTIWTKLFLFLVGDNEAVTYDKTELTTGMYAL